MVCVLHLRVGAMHAGARVVRMRVDVVLADTGEGLGGVQEERAV